MYNRSPIPKPVDKPKKKKQNGYKDKANRYCYYHKEIPSAERHEVYRGANRQTSIDHGFQVDLCSECHREMTANITDQAKERNTYWKEYWQKVYEDKLIEVGVKPKQARSLWMILIGRNYSEPLEEE